MKLDAINSAKFIARFCRFSIQASYCGHCPSEEFNRYEQEVSDLIRNASNQDFDDAFDECVECGMSEDEVTSNDILRVIGDKAKTECESLMLDCVNVIDEKSVSDLSFDLRLKALKGEKRW